MQPKGRCSRASSSGKFHQQAALSQCERLLQLITVALLGACWRLHCGSSAQQLFSWHMRQQARENGPCTRQLALVQAMGRSA